MSLKTWKQKYYPKKPTTKMTWLQAINHSITKWSGMDEDTLAEYGVYCADIDLNDRGISTKPFKINSSSCALCVKAEPSTFPDCVFCPITIMRGSPCDASQGNTDSEFSMWCRLQDPKPMQELLKETLEYIKENPDKFT